MNASTFNGGAGNPHQSRAAQPTQLYSVGIFDPFEYRSRTPEELNGPSLLTEVTELTGGRAFTVEKCERAAGHRHKNWLGVAQPTPSGIPPR
jgi:hypothetical protein